MLLLRIEQRHIGFLIGPVELVPPVDLVFLPDGIVFFQITGYIFLPVHAESNDQGVDQGKRSHQGIHNGCHIAFGYQMMLELPTGYPGVDAPPSLNFLTVDSSGQPIPHPWHPNIRYFGAFAGKVCINMADTYTDLLWGVERVASYLRYDTYHAIMEPPYPEDLKVAAWVRHQGEPNGWIYFEQKTN